MAYWWVSQGKTFAREREAGFLWAPLHDRGGGTPFHWQTMADVRRGDTIFSYVSRAFPAVSIAKDSARADRNPFETEEWSLEGRRVDVSYEDIDPPIELEPMLVELMPLLSDARSPLMKNGNGFTGYLFALPPRAGRFLAERIDLAAERDVQEVATTRAARDTEREALGRARIGQGEFRRALEREFSGLCAVTSLGERALLRASHVKPWRDCNSEERLNPANGLLLSAAYDAAFDAGLISFTPDGGLLLSNSFAPADARLAGIEPSARLRIAPTGARAIFLGHHRKEVFRG
jgi:hypothetical protein